METKATITARILTPFLSGIGTVWLRRQERKVQEQGQLLNAHQFEDALRAGVIHPEEVRILKTDSIPLPFKKIALLCSKSLRTRQVEPVGLCAQYGIFIKKSDEDERNILVHELVHTRQYERAGGIGPFLRRYLLDCLSHGYSGCKMETEAVRAAAAICA